MSRPLVFLTGLPRSRTAWFANLLTWGDSIVGHDVPSAQLMHDFHHGTLSGHSCASNLLMWRQLHDLFPTARWAVIDRSFMSAFRASRNAAPDTTYGGFCGLYCALEELKSALNPFILPYDAINLDTCYTLADHLGIDIGPQRRVAQLLDMQVQIHPAILTKRIAALQQAA